MDGIRNNEPTASNKEEGSFTRHDICRVAVRPPPFWPQEPAVWFAQLEGNFVLSGIKDDDTKYYYVTSTLEQKYAAEVKDIITSPPEKGKYDKLKAEIIKRLSASREKEMKQLLMHEELGDRKPTQFLRHLQHLAGPHVPEEFLKTIWTSRLPSSLQTVVACQPNSDLQSLAELADTVHDIVPASPHVATTQTSPGSALDVMAKQISELTKQVQALTTSGGRQSRAKIRDNSRTRNNSTTRTRSTYKRFPNCWYHYKFGSKANRCVKPCDFKAENSKSGH